LRPSTPFCGIASQVDLQQNGTLHRRHKWVFLPVCFHRGKSLPHIWMQKPHGRHNQECSIPAASIHPRNRHSSESQSKGNPKKYDGVQHRRILRGFRSAVRRCAWLICSAGGCRRRFIDRSRRRRGNDDYFCRKSRHDLCVWTAGILGFILVRWK
jgi:hypothetical protein